MVGFLRKRQCHIYPFNEDEPSTGHAAVRTHSEVKRQAMEVCSNKEAGKKVYLLTDFLCRHQLLLFYTLKHTLTNDEFIITFLKE